MLLLELRSKAAFHRQELCMASLEFRPEPADRECGPGVDRVYSPQSGAAGLVQVGGRLAVVECPLVCFRWWPGGRPSADAARSAAGIVPAVS